MYMIGFAATIYPNVPLSTLLLLKAKYSSRGLRSNADRYEEPEPGLSTRGFM